MKWFDPAPAVSELPAVLANPFDAAPPHPLARRAADELIDDLRAGRFGVDAAALDAPGGGKMFGVLVVRDMSGRVGYLRAFSGMLDGRWELDGFAPPLFDRDRRERMWPAGQDALRAHELALRALDADPAVAAAQAALLAFDARAAEELAELKARHRANRSSRRAARVTTEDAAAMHALDQASRADAAERRRLEEAHAAARLPLAEEVAELERERGRIEVARAEESRELMKQLHDTYVIANARGERRALRELFAPGEPPGGAGDCAAPKLLGAAYRQGLTPLALAEVWWGAPPATGGRHAGAFYPSCRGKCGPILPFMLEGLPHAAATEYGARPPTRDLSIVFEDAWLVVVDKPAELLSIPGRSGALRDSVQTRLRAQFPDATVTHRLDLDTSGLLVVAKDLASLVAVQAQFARREVDKRYVALVDGDVRGDTGVIELPLRVDLDDRPRNIVDPVHGKPAVTRWTVVERASSATRLALVPHTGRTHQLRVHCAHPAGLDAPIVGDRLYGRRTADRLMLHAERLAFTHPVTGARVELVSPVPF